MKIIVDSNIIFSALLKYTGSIGDLLFNSEDLFSFSAPQFLQQEIEDHWSKLRSISKLSEEELRQSQFRIYQRIEFHDEKLISSRLWLSSESLVKEIDIDDVAFVALARHLRGMLWSGDRTLVLGLRKAGYTKVITTQELLAIRRDLREG